jgi:hypothetical protein
MEEMRNPWSPCFAGRVRARSAVRLCDCEMRAVLWNERWRMGNGTR